MQKPLNVRLMKAIKEKAAREGTKPRETGLTLEELQKLLFTT